MIDPLIVVGIIIATIFILAFVIAAILRTVTPPNKIDIVIRRNTTRIYCAHPEYFLPMGATQEEIAAVTIQSTYYKIPSWMPMWGMQVRRMPLRMLEIKVPNFVAFDEKRARFTCDIVAFVAVSDGIRSSMRMPETPEDMSEQLRKVLQATMRDSTTKMTVRKTINNRDEVITMIRPILQDAIEEWGLSLKDIEIIGFDDASDSTVVSDISAIREKEINTEMREKNAEQDMKARVAEAETKEKAKVREIQQDEVVQKREQDKLKLIANQEKEAREQQLEVTRVNQVKQQKIDKQQAEVLAEQVREVAKIDAMKQKEVEAVIKEQKLLEGQGDKLRRQEQAKGEAAPIREKGTAEADVVELKLLAEAKGKDELQKALNKFGNMAIAAMTAIREIEKNETVGVAGADALKYADVKAFLGGSAGAKAGWEVGKSLESLLVSNPSAGVSVLNRTAQPNDLGFKKYNYTKMLAVIEETPELKQQIRDAMDKVDLEEEKASSKPDSSWLSNTQDKVFEPKKEPTKKKWLGDEEPEKKPEKEPEKKPEKEPEKKSKKRSRM